MEQFEKLNKSTSEELDKILGIPFKVLDKGFIRVVDYMGTDSSIVQAARVSYGVGTKQVSEDEKLIRYLLRNMHTSPFEMCEIKLHIKVPMDAWRQWIRHRTANVNEYSTRYSIAIDDSQQTLPGEWRFQAADNKQGSSGFVQEEEGKLLTKQEEEFHKHARDIYNSRIENGIAREQARKDLPLSTYTEAYWKIDLQNLLRFLKLRMDPHAQYEIRRYAEVIGEEILSKWCPLTWKAFKDYMFNSTSFSGIEMDVLKQIVSGTPEDLEKTADESGWLKKRKDGTLVRNRERLEFEEKISKLGITAPWNK
ncbi:MAG: FAD-dependent thymidylate synthase [Melioribacteraceae bacterium]|nr:FAD-dependent thymidylate synthase [Melioribacteraceae bacterium]